MRRTDGDAVVMRTEFEPVIHEFRVDTECAYRVYEMDHANLEATCQALSRREDVRGCTVSLVVSHVPLSPKESERLPVAVPWLVANRAMVDVLLTLRRNLVEPILRRGLVGVDFVDYASALSRGERIRTWSTRGRSGAECVARLPRVAGRGRRIAAACLHIRAPIRFGLVPFDEVGASIEHRCPALASEECLVVVAATPEERMDVALSLLVVLGSER